MNPEYLDGLMTGIVTHLRNAQQPDGSFRTMIRFHGPVESWAKPTEFPDWYKLDCCTFGTSSIVLHLGDIDLPGVAEIRRKACHELAASMENGVARWSPAKVKPIDFPADVDDTCLVALALEANGFPSGCNTAMVLDNQDGDGNLYTWLQPRWRHLRHPRNFLWLSRDYKVWTTRLASYGWPKSRFDAKLLEYTATSETGIATNVLLLLGSTPKTKGILRKLIHCVAADDVALGYYKNLHAVYFHVARLFHAGIDELGQLKPIIVNHFKQLQQPSGEVEGPFNTAIAALSYMYLDCWDEPGVEAAVRYLASHEMHTKGWQPLHYCNDLDRGFDSGVPDLAAVLYLEVLYRYRHHLAETKPLGENGA